MRIKIVEQVKDGYELDQKIELKINYMAKILQINLKIKAITAQKDEYQTRNVKIQLTAFMIFEIIVKWET